MKPTKDQAQLAFDVVSQAARLALLNASQHEDVKMALGAIKALVEDVYKEDKEPSQ